MSDISRLPQPGVVIDLDLEERDAKDVKPPFIASVGGETITFADPDEIDWEKLAEVRIPADLLRISLSKEDRKHLLDAKLPTWKFKRLMDRYYSHYDLEERILEARRQANFSG